MYLKKILLKPLTLIKICCLIYYARLLLILKWGIIITAEMEQSLIYITSKSRSIFLRFSKIREKEYMQKCNIENQIMKKLLTSQSLQSCSILRSPRTPNLSQGCITFNFQLAHKKRGITYCLNAKAGRLLHLSGTGQIVQYSRKYKIF